MASTVLSSRAGRVPEWSLPPHLAELMRPEPPSLADGIIAEIRATIPEYDRPLEGSYGRVMRAGVHQALESFVELVADPDAPRSDLTEMCRRLGRYEAREGRSTGERSWARAVADPGRTRGLSTGMRGPPDLPRARVAAQLSHGSADSS